MQNWRTSLFGALTIAAMAAKAVVPAEYVPIVEEASKLFLALGAFFAADGAARARG